MRIAQVAPLWEMVPPATYGGTELVVYNLTQEMVRQGHEVTLFACAGSRTDARLVECAPRTLRAMGDEIKADKTHCTVMSYELMMLDEVFRRADEFDVIHNHVGFQPLAFADFVSTPVVTTLHNALKPEPVEALFYRKRHLPMISISNYQQKLWPGLNYAKTIYHGIETGKFNPCFSTEGKDYLVFLGRLSPEKGPQHAIRIARELDMPLVLAGKIDRVDRIFYDAELARHIDGEQIRYIGEVNHEQKVELLRNARACLCPVTWPEPFGLVLIEAMACGTPVLALRDGSIPEVVDHGVTGYVADSVEELLEAARHWAEYDRKRIRAVMEARFSVKRMADEHLTLYEQLVTEKKNPGKGRHRHRPKIYAALTPDLTPRQLAEKRKDGLAGTFCALAPGKTASEPRTGHPVLLSDA